ncbi:POTRA domain-containing protein [Pantoea sp. At-9b]|uniref:POTRA domain-containing protein n=1 Tax=Pantoea sp. (strain At-9b) TaxID=592316 RepID=UPI0001B3E1A0|nr:POTRA domain-containing protein [Pantoea sp. At-9b]
MKKTIRPLLALAVLSASESTTADIDLNRLVKSQQDLENNTRQENKLVKKDVYSKVERLTLNNIDFPVEEHCVEVDGLIIEENFINDALIKAVESKIVGRCLGTKGIEQLANVLQDHFINSGYITTRIEIPNQDLTTRKLTLAVVPGRIEKVLLDNSGVKEWI